MKKNSLTCLCFICKLIERIFIQVMLMLIHCPELFHKMCGFQYHLGETAKHEQTKVGDPTEVADTEDIEEAVDGHQDGKLC